MARTYKVWMVVDGRTGEVVLSGRRKACVDFIYPRFVYSHEFFWELYRTDENMVEG